MTTKEEIKLVEKLIKQLKKDYKKCKDLSIGCPICQKTILIAYLEEHLADLEYYLDEYA